MLITGLISASAPRSHVSSRTSSNDFAAVSLLLLALEDISFLRTIVLPSPSTTSSSAVISSLNFSPKILFSFKLTNPPFNKTALTNTFSARLKGDITLCMARPTIIPFHKWRPTVIHIPKRVDVMRPRAVVIRWSLRIFSWYCVFALGSANGYVGDGGVFIN